jgi:predicted HicB family RNase H-like nuclease
MPGLDGCQSHGESVEELLRNLEEAKCGWLETKLEHGDPIPELQEEYSGKINLRMPKSLHRQLAVEAQLEGVSLNQYMLYKLSKSLQKRPLSSGGGVCTDRKGPCK